MHSMRILQVITPSRIAGAEIYLGRLAKGLSERGAEVVVLTKRVPEVVEKYSAEGLNVVVGGIGGKLNLFSVIRLCRLIRSKHIDVINSHLSTASLIAGLAGKICGVPTVATVHALNNAFCYRFVDRLIAVSQAVKEHLESQGVPGEKISVIYPGIDPDEFRPVGRSEIVRHEFGIPESAVLIGVVAHLSRKKGHAVLLESAAKLTASGREYFYLFVGDGDEKERLLEMVEKLDIRQRVVFAGFRSDIRDVIEALDIVVLPSIEGEGLPAALLQAMALEKPVVASRISGIPEIVEDGKTGLLTAPGDAECLAHALETLADDEALRTNMGRQGRKRVLSTFDIKSSVEQTLELYERMIVGAG